jgi:hypothetical protein
MSGVRNLAIVAAMVVGIACLTAKANACPPGQFLQGPNGEVVFIGAPAYRSPVSVASFGFQAGFGAGVNPFGTGVNIINTGAGNVRFVGGGFFGHGPAIGGRFHVNRFGQVVLR